MRRRGVPRNWAAAILRLLVKPKVTLNIVKHAVTMDERQYCLWTGASTSSRLARLPIEDVVEHNLASWAKYGYKPDEDEEDQYIMATWADNITTYAPTMSEAIIIQD